MNLQEQSGENIRVAGVILAGGSASRMGQPKQLLIWQGEALVRLAARTALNAGLSPVVVVTGARGDEVAAAVRDLPVQVVHNPLWAAGQSTSVGAGINALPDDVNAALFLLADQPFVSAGLIGGLIRAYSLSRPQILATYVGEKRTNPVLFDRSTFGELRQLEGDVGARSIFSKIVPAAFPWPDARLLFDVDTPEDYQKLLQG